MSLYKAPQAAIRFRGANPVAPKYQWWLYSVFAAIAYQKPLLEITPYARANPCLIDVVTIAGIFWILPGLPTARRESRWFVTYRRLVLWFMFCGTFYWAVILPSNKGIYSVFFAAREIQYLFVLYLAVRVPLDKQTKRRLFNMVVCMGVFTTAYCIPEYLNPRAAVQVREDLSVAVAQGALVGPFGGATYGKLRSIGSLYTVVILGLAIATKNSLKRIILAGVALVAALPVLFCGSRSGVAFLAVSLTTFGVLYLHSNHRKGARKIGSILLITILGVGGAWLLTNTENSTIRRMMKFESVRTGNDTASRIGIVFEFGNRKYTYQDLLPFIGAGYGVAPIDEGGSPRYRIGYGFHQTYLENYEQGGAVAFVLFFVLIFNCYRTLRQGMSFETEYDSTVAMAVFSFFVANLVNSLVGNSMWYDVSGLFFWYLVHIAGTLPDPKTA